MNKVGDHPESPTRSKPVMQNNVVSVLKFGGTSVGSGERIRRVAAIIANTLKEEKETFPVVVVSAMSGVTDQLLRIARHACSGEYKACQQELQALKEKHFEAIESSVTDEQARKAVHQEVEEAVQGL